MTRRSRHSGAMSLQLDAAGSWETRWTLAKAYYQQEEYDEALKMSQEALAGSNGKAPEIGLLVAPITDGGGALMKTPRASVARLFCEIIGDHMPRSGHSATLVGATHS